MPRTKQITRKTTGVPFRRGKNYQNRTLTKYQQALRDDLVEKIVVPLIEEGKFDELLKTYVTKALKLLQHQLIIAFSEELAPLPPVTTLTGNVPKEQEKKKTTIE